LAVFDVFFLIDRFLDLFVSYYDKHGEIEKKLYSVLANNISSKFLLEILMTLIPAILHADENILSSIYVLCKLPRYSRMFEMDTHITNYIDS
jgi:hypothetical protein